MLRFVLVALAILPGARPAASQPTEEYQALVEPIGNMLSGCLMQSRDRAGDLACRDLTRQACEAMGSGGFSTVGIVMCNQVLYPLWDAELNRLWPTMLDGLSERDADYLLREQRAWIEHKEATCRYEAERYAEGSMGAYTGGVCLIDMTAERVADFRELLRAR